MRAEERDRFTNGFHSNSDDACFVCFLLDDGLASRGF